MSGWDECPNCGEMTPVLDTDGIEDRFALPDRGPERLVKEMLESDKSSYVSSGGYLVKKSASGEIYAYRVVGTFDPSEATDD